MSSPKARLCIFCRRLEPIASSCPTLQILLSSRASFTGEVLKPVTPLPTDDEELLESLQSLPSELCRRCSAYNVLNVFQNAEPLATTHHMGVAEYTQYCKAKEKFEMALGDLSTLVLEPSCPLCRLIYRICPRDSLDPEMTMKLVPYRSFVRDAGWENLPADLTSRCAIFLGLRTATLNLITGVTSGVGSQDDNIRHGIMLGEGIALSSRDTFPGRTLCNARLVGPTIDFPAVKRALELCRERHGSSCQPNDMPELRTTLMLDVNLRKVVPCPESCDYFALSYVWGGVMPAPDALESRALPQTIEDAITVTKNLGRNFLWVDALCINQSQDPSPEELKIKMQQLNMMDLIYAGATATIVALAGSDSNAGLVGVSTILPRTKQMQEVIGGRTLFTIPPHNVAEIEASIWNTRAWTLQEGVLSKRYPFFTKNQLQFSCLFGSISESHDAETFPSDTIRHPGNILMEALTGPLPSNESSSSPLQLDVFGTTMLYAGMLTGYTGRRMTNSMDSLNAFLGILSAFQRRLFATGFVCGLPLQSHPESLAWMHDRKITPIRRPEFPSWSWAGWQGTIVFPDLLFDQRDRRGQRNGRSDMKPKMLSHDNSGKIMVEGWTVALEVVAEPFSMARIPGTHDLMGSIVERNMLHANTISSGRYHCLVIQRVAYQPAENGSEKQVIFMIILDRERKGGNVASRRTMVSLWTFQGEDFMKLLPERKVLTLV